MSNKKAALEALAPSETLYGFELIKKQFVSSKNAELYTLRHKKTQAELLYFDRSDENKTFAISFKTLPEDDTGVFHILEHSVLNGSDKYPVKEPFVSLLQSSMQTFLNAMTYPDKTVFPVSSRNEQDFMNLVTVYLDAVFRPMIYKKPEIFMQEGWHYEFDDAEKPFYNGVVFSEMKGVYADVESMMSAENDCLLFPDNSYGYSSGGKPEHITDLSYEQFVATHKRFYHPTNAKIFLDGHMDIEAVLKLIDKDYLSLYDYKKPDFDFKEQQPKTSEKTVCYEACEGEERFCQMAISKIACSHSDTEKIYAMEILADYLTGSSTAPLKRAFLENGLAQDLSLEIRDGVYQPYITLMIRNTEKDCFEKIKKFLPKATEDILKNGLDHEALLACLERYNFTNREISEPYGLELTAKALNGWLYGDDPLTHIETDGIFSALREKIETGYFEALLTQLLQNADDKCYLYAIPSLSKGQADAENEAARLSAITEKWTAADFEAHLNAFKAMQSWQQSPDSEEALSTLPHLKLDEIPETVTPTKTDEVSLFGKKSLKIHTETNGIAYLNMYFSLADLSADELKLLNVFTTLFGELRTRHYNAKQLQTKIKLSIGSLSAKLELASALGDLENCTPYLVISAGIMKENVPAAVEILKELLTCGVYDEADQIHEILLQTDYFLKQSLVGSGHVFAITKALSSFSKEGFLKEMLEGESFCRWFKDFTEQFAKNKAEACNRITVLSKKIFTKDRLFLSYSDLMDDEEVKRLYKLLPDSAVETSESMANAADFTANTACSAYNTAVENRQNCEGSKECKADKHSKDSENSCVAENGDSCKIEIPADVGFSALGHNIYRLGGAFSGHCSVLSSLMTFSYLWNCVRVQGGAYGTGMNIRANGDIFCYSYRDPSLENSRSAFIEAPQFLEEFLLDNPPLDDIIIGTVNTTDPLLEPAAVCELEAVRYLKGTTSEMISKIRKEILTTTPDDLKKLLNILKAFSQNGCFCAVGGKKALAFLEK